jgi:phosphatidylinositol alpha-1,6-mannosyltransferase
MKLKESIINFNLSEYVKLVGKVNGKDKKAFLKNADLFVMPSYRVDNSIEGFGISYVEAAAYAIPSISGIEGGVKDAVIDCKTGWCVNPLDNEVLSKTLMDAINHKSKREKYGINAQKKILRIFFRRKSFWEIFGYHQLPILKGILYLLDLFLFCHNNEGTGHYF